ncbi:hypothetical protein D3C80_1911630 [compost metagenome]
MRAGPGDGREVETGFLGETTGKRRSEDALAGLCDRGRCGSCGCLLSLDWRSFGLFFLRCLGFGLRRSRSGIAALSRLGHIFAFCSKDGD